MKRALLTTAIASLAAVGLVTVVPAAARAAATVVNPDFNQSGGTTTPPGWSTFSPNGTASASYTEATSNGYGGDAYQLTHWSSAAYNVDTYQTLSGLSDGFYTLGVWTRSSGGDVSDRIALTGCGGPDTPTAVPADSDGGVGADRDVRPRDQRALHDQPGHRRQRGGLDQLRRGHVRPRRRAHRDPRRRRLQPLPQRA